jgi:DNA-binding transcriptional LysR family regulator
MICDEDNRVSATLPASDTRGVLLECIGVATHRTLLCTSKPMELRHLRYLVAVAEELHFGRAAIRLNISQPPLSQQIRQLEEELGVQLFQRNKREVRLTDAGKRIVAEAQRVLSQIDHFSRVAAQAGEGEIGHVSVGVPGGVNEILVETLRLVAKQYPGVRVELQYMTTGMQIEALREGGLQVGFLNLPVQEPTLALETVRKEPLWLAMPKDHPLGRYRRVPLAALKNHGVIIFPRRVAPGLHDAIIGMCRNAGVNLNAVHETDSVVASLTLVSADLGIAFCTPSVRRLWPDIAFRPLQSSVHVEQAVAYKRDAQSPVVGTFLNVVRQVARKNAR